MSKAAASKPRAKPAAKAGKEAPPPLQPRKVLVNGPQKQVFIIDGQTHKQPVRRQAIT